MLTFSVPTDHMTSTSCPSNPFNIPPHASPNCYPYPFIIPPCGHQQSSITISTKSRKFAVQWHILIHCKFCNTLGNDNLTLSLLIPFISPLQHNLLSQILQNQEKLQFSSIYLAISKSHSFSIPPQHNAS